MRIALPTTGSIVGYSHEIFSHKKYVSTWGIKMCNVPTHEYFKMPSGK